MKGIILAGGNGSRLYPITQPISKQLLPVYDKPMIYYPLSTLIKAGVNDILIICMDRDLNSFQKLFDNGTKFGLKIQYKVQDKPNGIAEAFLIAEDFIDNEDVVLILGDNIFFDIHTSFSLSNAIYSKQKSCIFVKEVENPSAYGVVKFNKNNKVVSIEEKPLKPKSNFIATGLYYYNKDVVQNTKLLKPSKRNELEITDLNNIYLQKNELHAEIVSEEWFDAGTYNDLLKVSNLIKNKFDIGKLNGFIEIDALNKGFISQERFNFLTHRNNSDYDNVLKRFYSDYI